MIRLGTRDVFRLSVIQDAAKLDGASADVMPLDAIYGLKTGATVEGHLATREQNTWWTDLCVSIRLFTSQFS